MSSENAAVCTDLYITLDLIPVAHMVSVFLREPARRKLVEILFDPVVFFQGLRLVTEVDARLGIALDLVLFNLGVRAATACDPTSLVVFD